MTQFTKSIKKDAVAGAIFDRQERSDQLLKIFTEDAHFAAEAITSHRPGIAYRHLRNHPLLRTLTQLVRILPRCRHDPTLPWNQTLHETRGASLRLGARANAPLGELAVRYRAPGKYAKSV